MEDSPWGLEFSKNPVKFLIDIKLQKKNNGLELHILPEK